jgi:hypothetical protein
VGRAGVRVGHADPLTEARHALVGDHVGHGRRH